MVDNKEYIRSQSMAAGPVHNSDLKCRDCTYRNNNMPTAYCFMFRPNKKRKPNSVLLGGDCPEYEKEDD